MKRVVLTVAGLFVTLIAGLLFAVPAVATGGHPPCWQQQYCPHPSTSPSTSKSPSVSPSASQSASPSPSASLSASKSPSVSPSVSVTPSPTGTPLAPVNTSNTLPLTGPPVWAYLVGGLALVAAGVVLVVRARRRRIIFRG